MSIDWTPRPEFRWLIVAAVAKEIEPLVRDRAPVSNAGGWPRFELDDSIGAVICGVGRANAAGAVATALATASKSDGDPFALVLNVGVAGALPGGGLAVGDLIVATESVFFEEGLDLPTGAVDMNGLGFPLAEGDWIDGNRITPDASLVDALVARLPGGVRRDAIATVARCSGTDRAAREVVKQTRAVAEAMEGAASSLIARRFGVHAAELRVISNTCGDRERQSWDLSAALKKLHAILPPLLHHE
ncbi:MAG: futalosine hydrolase [Phycisphaerales bacterium]